MLSAFIAVIGANNAYAATTQQTFLTFYLLGFGLTQLAYGDRAMVGANLSAGVASAVAALAAGAGAIARRRRPA